ncbi:16S rRNA methyltransferase [Alteromonas aestuariivivens]|uniref:Ribosomal RNA small subunit methyltransferase J n=1 Tax=Alteromonas aestuariivivens TaxID=1938339 RepID=A0A3D8M6Z0_9ALTE|nr:class I SAM-dependent methyltransferase [Alteromonas aestuariivivens]RDV25488.1 16S rRNA methyltransferase [Alteromonas aestuariivivens]
MPEITQLYLATDAQGPAVQVASELAENWGFTLTDQTPQGMALVYEGGQLQLRDFADPKVSGVAVDFLSGSSLYRKQHGGGRKEPIAKAIGIKGDSLPVVLDATPGLGRDAFVLASLGCKVILVERSKVVAALLQDGLSRLSRAAPELGELFTLIHGDSSVVMNQWHGAEVDSIYLDPMFPHRKKSAQVKKEMRLFQTLLGHDEDADALLEPALKLARNRVVVKRPNNATVLAGQSPTMAITSKKHRFDVYLARRTAC